MASVQEVLAALQAQKSPFASLLEGVASGVSGAQDHALENAKTMIALQEQQRKMAQQAEMQRQIADQMETQTQTKLKSTGGTPTVLPVQKLTQEIKQDESGNYSRTFKMTEPKDVSYQKGEYVDTAGKNRTGRFNPTTGKIEQSPDDPYAPQSVNATNASEKRLTAFGDALDPSKQRTGAFGTSKQVFDRAERLESLANAYPDGNLDSRQVEELAIGLNAMLSGSNTGAQAQVASLVPKSAVGNANKIAEWLTNGPRGTGQQEFVSRMLGSVQREKQTAADQIKRTQFSRITRYADLEKSNPDEFANVLQSNGIDPQEYQGWKKGGFKPMTAVQAPDKTGGDAGGASFTPDVVSYAQKHSITPAQALSIKMLRTGAH